MPELTINLPNPCLRGMSHHHHHIIVTEKHEVKTHKLLNRMLFNYTKRGRTHIFEGIVFFNATNNTKHIQIGAAGSVPLEGCTLSCFVLLYSVLFNPFCGFFFSESRQSPLFQICFLNKVNLQFRSRT